MRTREQYTADLEQIENDEQIAESIIAQCQIIIASRILRQVNFPDEELSNEPIPACDVTDRLNELFGPCYHVVIARRTETFDDWIFCLLSAELSDPHCYEYAERTFTYKEDVIVWQDIRHVDSSLNRALSDDQLTVNDDSDCPRTMLQYMTDLARIMTNNTFTGTVTHMCRRIIKRGFEQTDADELTELIGSIVGPYYVFDVFTKERMTNTWFGSLQSRGLPQVYTYAACHFIIAEKGLVWESIVPVHENP